MSGVGSLGSTFSRAITSSKTSYAAPKLVQSTSTAIPGSLPGRNTSLGLGGSPATFAAAPGSAQSFGSQATVLGSPATIPAPKPVAMAPAKVTKPASGFSTAVKKK